MKTNYFFFFTIVFTFFLQSCKKETSNSVSLNAVTKTLVNSTFKTLDLRPGPTDGQDAYVEWISKDTNQANGNFNYVPELPIRIVRYDANGGHKQRIFICFTGLATIPQNATVTSAFLYLYGLDFSLNSPQGNYGNNTSVVVQVTKPWDENTITWNNQPTVSYTNRVYFGPSDLTWNWDAEINVTSIVRNMVKYPTKNYGFGVGLRNERGTEKVLIFGSSEAVNVNDRPRLVVNYTL